MNANTNVLEVEHLSVRLGNVEILRDLSFSVARGSSLAVIGPNGSGKTVLFRALIGSLPHTGTVRWASNARIGYVPQKLDIERDLPVTGRDLLLARARLAGRPVSEIEAALTAGAVTIAYPQAVLGAVAAFPSLPAESLEEAA